MENTEKEDDEAVNSILPTDMVDILEAAGIEFDDDDDAIKASYHRYERKRRETMHFRRSGDFEVPQDLNASGSPPVTQNANTPAPSDQATGGFYTAPPLNSGATPVNINPGQAPLQNNTNTVNEASVANMQHAYVAAMQALMPQIL